MANRNRTAGHNFERLIVQELKDLGFDVVTTRSESRNLDNKGVDIFGPEFHYYIQCKNSKSILDYHSLLKNQDLGKPLILFHRKTHKANKRFVADGDYVVMLKEEFYKLLDGHYN